MLKVVSTTDSVSTNHLFFLEKYIATTLVLASSEGVSGAKQA